MILVEVLDRLLLCPSEVYILVPKGDLEGLELSIFFVLIRQSNVDDGQRLPAPPFDRCQHAFVAPTEEGLAKPIQVPQYLEH